MSHLPVLGWREEVGEPRSGQPAGEGALGVCGPSRS